MRGERRGRSTLLRAVGGFLLVVALGEFFAFSLVSKTISYRRGGALSIALNWEAFALLSAVGILVASWCAYRIWRGAAASDSL